MASFKKIITFSVFLVFLLITIHPVVAQKRRERKKEQANNQEQSLESTDPRLGMNYFMEAEKYYILEDYAKSLLLFQRTLEMEPDNAAVEFKIAQIYVQTGELTKALPYAQQSVTHDPKNKFYYHLLAQIYIKKSDFTHAASTYEKLISTIPNTDEYLFELAAIYYYQKDYDDALKCYDRFENIYGINEQASLQKKEIFIKEGKLDKAIEEGNKLINAYPDEPDYVEDQAKTLIDNDKSQEAIGFIEKWLPSYPDDGNLMLDLSEAYKSVGNSEKSKEYIDKAFNSTDIGLETKLQYIEEQMNNPLDSVNREFVYELVRKTVATYPKKAESYAIYGDLLSQLDSLDAAKEMYLKSLGIDDNNFQAWQNVINIEMNEGQWDNVIKHTEKAVEIFPNQAILYYFLGSSYYMKKDYTNSVANLEIGKKFSSSNLKLTSWFNRLLGDDYNYLKDYARSDSAYEAVLNFDPDDDLVLNNYAYFLSLRKERLDYANKLSAKLIQLHPDDPNYLDTRAWVLYNLGKVEDARKTIEKALQLNGDINGDIIEHYGDILYKLGKTKEAIDQWKKAKEMGGASNPDLLLKKISDGKLYE